MDDKLPIQIRLLGMFAGHFLGDALGAPHEFYRWNRDTIYTGRLEIKPYRRGGSRYAQVDIYKPVGSVTDDSQMTIALLRILIENNLEYDQDRAIQEYCDWAHSGANDMGRNTRFLFKNKTLAGYKSRVLARDREIARGIQQISLANGALMRCTPLALLPNWEEAVIQDTEITNPYEETISTSLVYVKLLRSILLGSSLEDTISLAQSLALEVEGDVRWVMNVALKNQFDLDISGKDKGLAVYGLYCAVRGLVLLAQGYGFRSIIRWVITQSTETGKGDTDTNAAITGALLGAYLGYDKLMKSRVTDSNWRTLMRAADEVEGKLARYVPGDFYSMVGQYTRLVRAHA